MKTCTNENWPLWHIDGTVHFARLPQHSPLLKINQPFCPFSYFWTCSQIPNISNEKSISSTKKTLKSIKINNIVCACYIGWKTLELVTLQTPKCLKRIWNVDVRKRAHNFSLFHLRWHYRHIISEIEKSSIRLLCNISR